MILTCTFKWNLFDVYNGYKKLAICQWRPSDKGVGGLNPSCIIGLSIPLLICEALHISTSKEDWNEHV